MYFQKKMEILKGRGSSQLWNSGDMGGGNTFWNFRRQGGVKTWKLSVVGYGYFHIKMKKSVLGSAGRSFFSLEKTFFKVSAQHFHDHHWLRKFPISLQPITIIQNYDV